MYPISHREFRAAVRIRRRWFGMGFPIDFPTAPLEAQAISSLSIRPRRVMRIAKRAVRKNATRINRRGAHLLPYE